MFGAGRQHREPYRDFVECPAKAPSDHAFGLRPCRHAALLGEANTPIGGQGDD
jgi:hypothetical protein